MMGRKTPLYIHRNEWERLKNQANPSMEPDNLPHPVDIEAMNEQSRKWISSWPESLQSYVNKLTKKNKKVRQDEIATIDALHKQKKHDDTEETLKKARDMIFERTGYGKELLSALMESKVLEYRELQIKFKKEIQEKEKEIEDAKCKVHNIMYAEFEKGERNRILKKQTDRNNAECNKLVTEMKRQEALEAAENEKKNREQDEIMMEKLRQLEILEEQHVNCLDKEGFEMYEQQHKAIQEMRKKREILDQKLADIWQKYRDRIRCKEKQMFDEIHKERHNKPGFRENYELVQCIQNDEEKKYNDFIDKGIKEAERRLQEKENEEKLKAEQQRNIKLAQAQEQKIISENRKNCEDCLRKLRSDKQSFLPTSRGKPKSKQRCVCMNDTDGSGPSRALQFLAPVNTLQQALQQRRALPSGWSGTARAHAQFARHAAAALAEATHKRPVRKVIDSYLKENNLKDLHIPNY